MPVLGLTLNQTDVASGLGWYHVENYGAKGDGTTDDTTAWQDAINAAFNAGGGVVAYNPDHTYAIKGALQQGGTNKANAQIVIPYNTSGNTVVLRFVAMGQKPGWENIVGGAAIGGPTLVSSLTGAAYDSTYGVPSVIGGATFTQVGFPGSYANLHVEGDLWVRTVANSGLAGIDFSKVGSAFLGAITVDNSGAVTEPTSISNAGLMMPAENNYATNRVDKLFITTQYAGVVVSDHFTTGHYDLTGCIVPIATYSTGSVHPVVMPSGQISQCPHGIAGWDPANGGITDAQGQPITIGAHIENTHSGDWQAQVDIVKDWNCRLSGRFDYTYLDESPGGAGGLTNGIITQLASNGPSQLRITRLDQPIVEVGQLSALPTAGATYRGKTAIVPGNGTSTADTMYICLESATGTYSWKQITAG